MEDSMKSTPVLVGLALLCLAWADPARADQRFSATLTGGQQVPAVASGGTGIGTVVLNTAETQITVNLSFSGLTSNANLAHIHGPAAAGANAGVLFDFSDVTPAATSGSIPERVFSITASQVSQLRAGQFYFNIHTNNFGGGEIRGQIGPAPIQKFSATLAGWQQVPSVSSGGTGTGTVALNGDETQIVVNLSFSGLTSNASLAHIHGPAAPGANAGVLFDFSGVTPAATSGSIPAQTYSISAAQVAQLKAGEFYFNIHTSNFGGGEIRGQITLAPIQKFTASFSGAQEVPPTGSPGTGPGTVLLNGTEDQITVMASFANLQSDANAAHIHGPAPPGVEAGVVFGLSGVPAATSGIIPDQSFAISATQVGDLKAGQHYFNIHTTGFGGGEIRGQIGAVPMLTVAKGGSGTSSAFVTSSPAGISCGGDCAEAYDSGTSVTLTAGAAAAGSFFAGWIGGGCSGTATCVVTLTADTTVTAVYSLSTTSFSFSDDPLSVGATPVKAAHIVELRNAVATLRANNQLDAFTFTDASLAAGTTISAVHITELRTALDAVFTRRSRSVISYTDPTITATITPIKALHVSELRLGVRLIE
jgi:hypothetical protein